MLVFDDFCCVSRLMCVLQLDFKDFADAGLGLIIATPSCGTPTVITRVASDHSTEVL
jgi:hypothetical protein